MSSFFLSLRVLRCEESLGCQFNGRTRPIERWNAQGVDLRTEGLGKHDSKVTETSDSDDADLLARSGAVPDEGRVHGH